MQYSSADAAKAGNTRRHPSIICMLHTCTPSKWRWSNTIPKLNLKKLKLDQGLLYLHPNTKINNLCFTFLAASSSLGGTPERNLQRGAMKFTDSPVIELTVRNAHLSIEQDNGSMHVGTSVWPCSLVLVKFIERWMLTHSSSPSTPNPYTHLFNFTGKRAIELGTGCGPAGMGLSLLGLDIILTDIAAVMPALKRNLKKNKPVLGKNLKTYQLYWNNPNQIKTLNPPFDFVIAADVVYIEESVGSLVSAMETLVADNGFILLGYQIRSPEAHTLFWEFCERVFVIEKVPHEDLHPEYAFEEADVYVMKKKL